MAIGSSIFDFDSATTFGALDSDAFDDAQQGGSSGELLGVAHSASFLRQMALNHNRMLSKPELLFNLIWPQTTHVVGGDASTIVETYSAVGAPAWGRIHPDIPILKIPGHTKLDFRTTLRVSLVGSAASTGVVYIQVTTGAAPFNPAATGNSVNVKQVTQSLNDGFVPVDLDDVPLLPGNRDEVGIYVSADLSTVAPDTGTYGSPASGTLDQADDSIWGNEIYDASASWNTSTPTNTSLVSDSFFAVFTDAAGNALCAPRRITAIRRYTHTTGSGRALQFSPALSEHELALARANQTYEFRAPPIIWITNLMAYSVERGT